MSCLVRDCEEYNCLDCQNSNYYDCYPFSKIVDKFGHDYFKTVTRDKFIEDLREAGFTVKTE